MVTFLCIVLALLTFMMSMAILVQEPKQAGLSGSFGMGGEQMLGAGSPNAISKFTGVLAVAFLALCLVIGLVEKSSMQSTDIRMEEGDTTGVSTEIEGGNGTTEGGAGTDPGTGSEGTGSEGSGTAPGTGG